MAVSLWRFDIVWVFCACVCTSCNCHFSSILVTTLNGDKQQQQSKVPFKLEIAPQNNLAICTKAGPGGERPGDILWYTTQWTLGPPRDGTPRNTALSYSEEGVWQCSVFDVCVESALATNVRAGTDEVVFIFERAFQRSEDEWWCRSVWEMVLQISSSQSWTPITKVEKKNSTILGQGIVSERKTVLTRLLSFSRFICC